MALPWIVLTRFNRSRQETQIFGVLQTFDALRQWQNSIADPQAYVPVLVFGPPPAGQFAPNTPVEIAVGNIVAIRFTGRIPSAFDENRIVSLQLGYGPWDSIASGQAWADSFPIEDTFLNVVGPILPLPTR